MTELLSNMTFSQLPADDPDVTRLVQSYLDKYGMGARDIASERAESWCGMKYDGKIVAVFGERRFKGTVEVTDAYYDGTLEGRTAFLALCKAYMAMVETGECDTLVHQVLYANADHWKAVMRETGDAPYALTFVHRKKGA